MSQGKFSFNDDEPTPQRFQREPSFFNSPPLESAQSPAAPAPAAKAKPAPPRIYSISELNRMIKLALSASVPAKITVRGELSGWSIGRNGHAYPTLKDENAAIEAAMWRSAITRLKFRPADGMAVIATGYIEYYEPRGKITFIIEKLDPAGLGALELAFQQLKEKLQKEGLFAQDRKKPLPAFPDTIAIVTSPDGQAIQDIVRTLNQRMPGVRKLLYPVAVQGDAAAGQIAAALKDINRRHTQLGGIDVIIVGRGGGSLEDLWPFNEEIVARAIFASAIPVISAVGHEGDVSIADLVADVRAATPTAAAVLAVPMRDEMLELIEKYLRQIRRAINKNLGYAGEKLERLASRPVLTRPGEPIAARRRVINEHRLRLARLLSDYRRGSRNRLQQAWQILRRIEPHRAVADARMQLQNQTHLLHNTICNKLLQRSHHLHDVRQICLAASPQRRLPLYQANLLEQRKRLQQTIKQELMNLSVSVQHQHQRAENVNPKAILKRGYSITRRQKNANLITANNLPACDDILTTELAGRIIVTSRVVTEPEKPES